MFPIIVLTFIFAFCGWYLWKSAKMRNELLEQLRESGFAFDETFEMGDSYLIIDRTRREVAFVNWSVSATQTSPFLDYTKSTNLHVIYKEPFDGILSITVTKPNNRTHRSVTINILSENFRDQPERKGYLSMATVVPKYSLEKMLPRLGEIAEVCFSQSIGLSEPLF